MRKPLTVASRANVQPFAVMDILQRVAELRARRAGTSSPCAPASPVAARRWPFPPGPRQIHSSAMPLTYTPPLGIAELRQAIAGHYKRWYGLDIPARNVAVTTGSSGAFMLVFLAAFNPGRQGGVGPPRLPGVQEHPQGLGD